MPTTPEISPGISPGPGVAPHRPITPPAIWRPGMPVPPHRPITPPAAVHVRGRWVFLG